MSQKAKTPQKASRADAPGKKILFVSAEAFPFAGTGGLGEVAGSLPKALNAAGADCRCIMPLYGTLAKQYRERLVYIGQTRVWVGWREQYCGVLSIENDGVTTYFIDNEYYFARNGIYGYGDEAERWSFFCRSVLEALPLIGFAPDIIHTNDHATALVSVYYKTEYAGRYGYTGIKNVFTIHNLEYQGWYPMHILGDVFGISDRDRGLVEFDGQINCIKGGIEAADIVTTVSPTYSREITMPERSFGLSGILNNNVHKLSGILNGINISEYDPKTSPFIAKNYCASDISGKAECKKALKSELGLERDRPIIAIISRLAGHKGLDLVKDDLCRENNVFSNADLIVLGTGERYLEDFFVWYSSVHDNARTLIKFDKALAQRIYAGADIFLMPSASEPCGLSQMMACRYGTVPVVRRTGGLADSITDCRASKKGNGFVFDDYTVDALDGAVRAALDMYDKQEWISLMMRAMRCDFSWKRSAGEYIKLYEKLF